MKFSIRSLFVLVVIIALGISHLLSQRRLMDTEVRLADAIQNTFKQFEQESACINFCTSSDSINLYSKITGICVIDTCIINNLNKNQALPLLYMSIVSLDNLKYVEINSSQIYMDDLIRLLNHGVQQIILDNCELMDFNEIDTKQWNIHNTELVIRTK